MLDAPDAPRADAPDAPPVVDAPDAPRVDAGPDGGGVCTRDSDCVAGQTCGPLSRCRVPCTTDAGVECQLVGSACGCGVGLGCEAVSATATTCRTVGPAAEGTLCDREEDCAAGLDCYRQSATSCPPGAAACRRYCDSDDDCATGSYYTIISTKN